MTESDYAESIPAQEPLADILIVDGVPENLHTIKAILKAQGYQVRGASDPQTALTLATNRPPDLMLLDITLPDMNGYEVCKRLKTQPESAAFPVVFLIAQSDIENLAEGYRVGGVAFLVKPVRPDELLAIVNIHLTLSRDRKEAQRHIASLEQCVTEQTVALQETARQLQESKDRFWNLMEQSPLAIEILVPTGEIRRVNPAWQQLWGFNEEETAQVLASYNMRTDKQVADLGIARLTERAFAGEPVILPPVEYNADRAVDDMGLTDLEASTHWVQCHLFPIKDVNGEIAYVVNTYVDITELRKAEQETRTHRDTVARMNRTTSMGQLTGAISHELNQPLTGILSNAQAAELMLENNRYEHHELVEIMAEIVADAKRAGEVIRNLRGLYRKQEGEFLPLGINAVVDETMRLLRSEFVLQDVRFTTACAASIPVVNGNRIQIQQVLINLIMNGHQAMRDVAGAERRIHIATSFHACEINAWVEDGGQGIDAHKLDRIFEPLATWKPGGTGMGLAISNSIIVAHGGRMWAENRLDGGARVGFSLPILNINQQKVDEHA